MARGLKNNNPLNIRKSKDVFLGENPQSTDVSFKQFTSMAYGYRAAFVTLGTYLSRGLNTIEKIVKTWAPPNENNTEGYIQHVSSRSGVPRNKVLTNTSGSDYIAIVAAMSWSENGVPAVMADVEAGFKLQTKIKKI
jgi:hypothetical protein